MSSWLILDYFFFLLFFDENSLNIVLVSFSFYAHRHFHFLYLLPLTDIFSSCNDFLSFTDIFSATFWASTKNIGCLVEVREWKKKSLQGKRGSSVRLKLKLNSFFLFSFLTASTFFPPFIEEWVKICWARHLALFSTIAIKESYKKATN